LSIIYSYGFEAGLNIDEEVTLKNVISIKTSDLNNQLLFYNSLLGRTPYKDMYNVGALDQRSFVAKYIYGNTHFKERFKCNSYYLDKLDNNRLLNERILSDFSLKEQSRLPSPSEGIVVVGDVINRNSLLYVKQPGDVDEDVDEGIEAEGFEVVRFKQPEDVDEGIEAEGFEVVRLEQLEDVDGGAEVSRESIKACFSSNIKKMEEELSLDANIRLSEDLGLGKAWEYTEFRPFLQEEIAKSIFSSEDDYVSKEKEHLYCAVDYSFMKVKGNANICGLNVCTYLYTKLKGGDQYFLHFKEYEFFINIKRYSEQDKLSLWSICVCEFSKKNSFNKLNQMIERSNNTNFLIKREAITALNADNKERTLNTFNNVFKTKAGPNALSVLSYSKGILHQ
jgi:hypothetical protein